MTDERTQELDEGFALIFSALLAGIHTATIGEVEDFDRNTRKATIQPALKRLISGGEPELLPKCEDVPILFPGSGDWSLNFDVVKKSYVLLVITERAIDKWKNEGGIVDPAIKRKFHLSDGVAIPCLNSFNEVFAPIEADSISIRNRDNSQFFKMVAGKIEAKAPAFKFEGDVEVTGNFSAAGGNWTVDL